MTRFNSSVITQPFNISVVTNNGTDELRRLVAPSWVNNPGVRGTMDILQSCILTLVACIYTALHLDLPRKTTWQHILWQKTKWVLITLFAPEIALYVAASQLRYAWDLRSELRKIQKEKQASNWKRDADFEINLKYAFCIIMGAVRFDIHDILSLSDLNKSDRAYFNNTGLRRRSVRPGPAAVIQLAERGHWIQIPKQDIDDKSKADIVQKMLVVIQVLWMVTQCIARRIYHLPLSLLEIHTIVHVVCAVFLYACWFEKPLGIQEAMIIQTQDFKGDLAAMVQRQFYSDLSCKMALFTPMNEDGDAPFDVCGTSMRRLEPRPGFGMYEGDILPSGLALSKSKVKKPWGSPTYYLDPQGESTGASLLLGPEFLARWEAILTTFPFEDREKLAKESDKIIMQNIDRRNEPHDSSYDQGVLFLPLLEEFEPKVVTHWEKLFWEGESILHLDSADDTEMGNDKTWKESMTRGDSWQFMVLAIALPGLYGGVHLTMWGQSFPSYVEEVMWKVSCLLIICGTPSFIISLEVGLPVASALESWNERKVRILDVYTIFSQLFIVLLSSIGLGYIVARVFIIVESFLSLRQTPVGVFLSPEWVELFPHL